MKNEYIEDEELDLNSLVGVKVTKALINETKDAVTLETDKGSYYLTWVGDCCANCYLAHASMPENLIGGTILEVTNLEWKDVPTGNDYEVIESMGTNIKTSKGYVTLESRVEHNGYYGGRINISKIGFIDQYSSLLNGIETNLVLEEF